MPSIRFQFAFVLAVVGLLWFSAMSSAQEPQSKESVVAQVAAEGSVVTRVAEGKAIVTYESGQLTITAQSAPLIDVLRAVCTQIGAELDAPSEPDEPVVGVFGPGLARDVLTTMMGRSHFNLAMAGSPDDPSVILRIVILPRSGDSADNKDNGPDALPAEDSSAQSHAIEEPGQAMQPTAASTSTASDVEARISEVRELFAQAHDELEQIARAANLDMNSLLKEAEAQANAEADPNSSPMPVAAAAPINRPRGRSRHTH